MRRPGIRLRRLHRCPSMSDSNGLCKTMHGTTEHDGSEFRKPSLLNRFVIGQNMAGMNMTDLNRMG